MRQSILVNDWAVSVDLTDAYLHVPIHPQPRKYPRFVFGSQVFQSTTLPYGKSLSLWFSQKVMNVIAAHLRQCAISPFPYLDDGLIRDTRRTNISHNILSPNGTKSRIHSKSKKGQIEPSSAIHLYRHGIPDTAKYSQSTTRSYGIPRQLNNF